MKTESVLKRLQAWYLRQCDGDWEHSYGVEIDTLDNPGWVVAIDLSETEWSDTKIERCRIENADHDWMQFEVSESRFLGSGSPMRLEDIVEAFLGIVEVASNRKG